MSTVLEELLKKYDAGGVDPLEKAVIYMAYGLQETSRYQQAKDAANELAYLTACAAIVEGLAGTEGTDATIAQFFRSDYKKVLKLKGAK